MARFKNPDGKGYYYSGGKGTVRKKIYRVECPNFSAGLIIVYGIAQRVAPCLKYFLHWKEKNIAWHIRRRQRFGWKFVLVKDAWLPIKRNEKNIKPPVYKRDKDGNMGVKQRVSFYTPVKNRYDPTRYNHLE